MPGEHEYINERLNILALTTSKICRIANVVALSELLNFVFGYPESDTNDQTSPWPQKLCLVLVFALYVVCAFPMQRRRSTEIVEAMLEEPESKPQGNQRPDEENQLANVPRQLIHPVSEQEEKALRRFYEITIMASGIVGVYYAILSILTSIGTPKNYAELIAAIPTAGVVFPLYRERALKKDRVDLSSNVEEKLNDRWDRYLFLSMRTLYPSMTALPQLSFSVPVMQRLIQIFMSEQPASQELGKGALYVMAIIALGLWYRISSRLISSNANAFFTTPRSERPWDWRALVGSVGSGVMLYMWLREFLLYKLPLGWNRGEGKILATFLPIIFAVIAMIGQYAEHYRSPRRQPGPEIPNTPPDSPLLAQSPTNGQSVRGRHSRSIPLSAARAPLFIGSSGATTWEIRRVPSPVHPSFLSPPFSPPPDSSVSDNKHFNYCYQDSP